MAEIEELYDELCKRLQGVLPDDLIRDIEHIEPRDAAVSLMLDLGGRLALRHPQIDLLEPYDYPPEVKKLMDAEGAFEFLLPLHPLHALMMAFRANQDIDETIIRAYDLENNFPIIITKGEEPTHIFMLDIKEHKLEIPFGMRTQIDVSLNGNETEDKAAMDDALGELGVALQELKSMPHEKPKWTDDPAEEEAVEAWLDKHAYERLFVMNMSVDLFH